MQLLQNDDFAGRKSTAILSTLMPTWHLHLHLHQSAWARIEFTKPEHPTYCRWTQ